MITFIAAFFSVNAFILTYIGMNACILTAQKLYKKTKKINMRGKLSSFLKRNKNKIQVQKPEKKQIKPQIKIPEEAEPCGNHHL